MKGIVAYSATKGENLIMLERAFAGHHEQIFVSHFEEAADWLLRDFGEAFYIAWDLEKFADVLLSVAPEDVRERIKNGETKVYVGNIKIFFVERWLGLTRKSYEPIKGNIVKESVFETNFFGLNAWLAEDRKEPDVEELAKLGEQVLEALETLNIEPTKLTSPAGVYSEYLIGKVPTVYSNESIMDASNYCLDMMNIELMKTYESSLRAPVYTADRASAYPSEMIKLPNTDKCKVVYSEVPIASHWAILKVKDFVCNARFNPFGDEPREGYTSEELHWNKSHGGTFTVLDGHYFTWLSCEHPYEKPLMELWIARQKGGILGEVCKRKSNGISGKLDQENNDGKPGELCNWVLAAMMRSRNRLEIANFIEKNNLYDNLQSIQVDSVKSFIDLNLPKVATRMGEWRSK